MNDQKTSVDAHAVIRVYQRMLAEAHSQIAVLEAALAEKTACEGNVAAD